MKEKKSNKIYSIQNNIELAVSKGDYFTAYTESLRLTKEILSTGLEKGK